MSLSILNEEPPAAPPEFTLAAACVAWPPSKARTERVRAAAAGPIDWPLFLRMVERHRIAGLAHDALGAAEVVLPDDAAEQLRDEARGVLKQELFKASEAMRLQTLLAERGAPVLVLKGVAIALSAYGRLGLRYNHDIDLLVAVPDIHRGAAVLEEVGYVRIAPAADADPKEVDAWIHSHKDMIFEHADHETVVELHWRLLDNRNLLKGKFLEDAPRLVPFVGGRSFRTLPEDLQFVYLCVHGAEHAWSRLKWLADVGAILARLDDASIERLYRLGEAQGVGRAVAQAVLLCGALLGTSVPPAIASDAAHDVRIRWLEKIAHRSMVGPGDGAELEDLPFATTLKNFSHYLLADGWRYWLSEAKYDLRDTSESPLPPLLRGLWPVIRPVMWLWRKSTMQFRGLAGGPARL